MRERFIPIDRKGEEFAREYDRKERERVIREQKILTIGLLDIVVTLIITFAILGGA